MKPAWHEECLRVGNTMAQTLGRFILCVVVKCPKRLITWEFNKHCTSLHEVALQIFCSVYCRDQATTVLCDQLENYRYVFIVISLPVVDIEKNNQMNCSCVGLFPAP